MIDDGGRMTAALSGALEAVPEATGMLIFKNDLTVRGVVRTTAQPNRPSQLQVIEAEPEKFFKPPYVGVKGWVGIKLDQVGDDELNSHICQAWRMIAPVKLHTALSNGDDT